MSFVHAPRGRAVPLAALAGILLVAGCSGSGSSTARSTVDATSAVASGSASAGCTARGQGYPSMALAGAKVGFSQSEPDTAAFRAAETQSIMDEARAQGATLEHTNAGAVLAQQVADIRRLLDDGVQLLIVAPLDATGLQPAFDAARAKKVPVVTIDRLVTSKACTDYVTFIGSDFVSQGRRAAQALIAATGGKGTVAVLLGSSGNGVTTDRTSGFVAALQGVPGLTVVTQLTANFSRDQGRSVMAGMLRAHPGITAVYAENDEMGVGAVAAITAAGRRPGTDVKVVSIDGTHDAVQLLASGRYNGVIESNPRFGPLAFRALADFEANRPVAAKIVIQDDEYTPANATSMLPNAF